MKEIGIALIILAIAILFFIFPFSKKESTPTIGESQRLTRDSDKEEPQIITEDIEKNTIGICG